MNKCSISGTLRCLNSELYLIHAANEVDKGFAKSFVQYLLADKMFPGFVSLVTYHFLFSLKLNVITSRLYCYLCNSVTK